MKNTCLQEQSQKNLTLPLELLDIGLYKEKSNSSNLVGCDYIIYKALETSSTCLKNQLMRENEFYMLEYLQLIKNPILIDKSNFFDLNIRLRMLCQMSDRDLIGKGKTLMPFWNSLTKEVSSKLLLPTKTDFVDSDSSCLNGYVKSTIQKSWFSTRIQKSLIDQKNYQMTSFQLLQSLLQKTIHYEHVKIEKIGKKPKLKKNVKKKKLLTRTIKLFPNQIQTTKLKQWFGIYRYLYNKSVEYTSKCSDKYSLLQQLRDSFVKDINYTNENQWIKDLPADTRDYAIMEFYNGFQTNIKKRLPFSMKFKSRKDSSCTIPIRIKQMKTKRGNYVFLQHIKTSEPIPELTSEIKIQMNWLGEFYFKIPIEVSICVDNQDTKRIISLDPGVRTFLTGYSSDGKIFHIGENDIGRLARLQHYMFKLNTSGKTKFARRRIQRKINNLVQELHKKISKFLFDNFDIIICPKLNTTQMCRSNNLSRKVKNKMRMLCHCSFIDRLLMKSEFVQNKKVIVPTEEFTSKTCCNCGRLNQTLGMSKTFKCQNCKKEFDRDANGAINILLKTISKQ